FTCPPRDRPSSNGGGMRQRACQPRKGSEPRRKQPSTQRFACRVSVVREPPGCEGRQQPPHGGGVRARRTEESSNVTVCVAAPLAVSRLASLPLFSRDPMTLRQAVERAPVDPE